MAEDWKNKGNKEHAAKNFTAAIDYYTKAIELSPSNSLYYTNRSASYANLNQWDKSLSDAQKSLELNKSWVKGYFRSGVAYLELKKYDDAVKAFEKACELDPGNGELKKYLKQAEQEKKNAPKQTTPISKPSQNSNQFSAGENKILNPSQKAKEEGNEAFKIGKIPQAIEAYTRALNLSTDSAEKATIYSNRAACYVQLYEPSKVVSDCSECLNIQPNNVKALIRRGLAYESLEKYKLALEDLQKVLQIDPSVKVAIQAVSRIKTGIKSQN